MLIYENMNGIIKDALIFTAGDAIKERTMPGMKSIVENGTSAIAYNIIVSPIVSKINLGTKVKPDTLNLVKKWASYTLLKGGMSYLIYKDKFDLGYNAMSAGVGVVVGEVWDFLMEGKMGIYF